MGRSYQVIDRPRSNESKDYIQNLKYSLHRPHRSQDVRATEKDRVKIFESFRPGDVVRAVVVSKTLDTLSSMLLSLHRSLLAINRTITLVPLRTSLGL